MAETDFLEKFFCPKILENGPEMGQKQSFLILLKDLVFNFYWMCSIMTAYIICCIPKQIPYLGKFLFLRYGPKCSQPIRFQDFLINHISITNQWNSLIKSWSKSFWVNMVKNGSGQSGPGTLKLTLSKEWIDVINWYFACWCKFRKAKTCFNDFWVGMVRNGHGHLVHETLKSTVSKEWIYEFSSFFICWLWGRSFWLGRYHTLYLWLLNANLLQLYLLDP